VTGVLGTFFACVKPTEPAAPPGSWRRPAKRRELQTTKAGHEGSCTPTGSYDRSDADAPRSDDPGAGRFAGHRIATARDPGGPGVGCGSGLWVRRGGAGPIPHTIP